MKINLITGMFKMESGDISVTDDAVVISTSENNRSIRLTDIENISVTRHAGRKIRLEINLKNEVIEGIFTKKSDADEFANSLKDSMGSVLQINFQGQ